MKTRSWAALPEVAVFMIGEFLSVSQASRVRTVSDIEELPYNFVNADGPLDADRGLVHQAEYTALAPAG